MLAAIDSCEQAVNLHVFFVVIALPKRVNWLLVLGRLLGTYGRAVERPIHTKPRFLRIALF